MSGTIAALSKKAFEDVLRRMQEEGDPFIKHPCGFFDFKPGGEVNVGDSLVSESILALGITRSHNRLLIPANILHCLVFGPKHYALAMSCEDSNRYILLRDSVSEKQWWIENDVKREILRIVDYEQIPENVRKAIDCELAKKAWKQIMTHLQMESEE